MRRPLQNLWLTGFLGRLACCAVPPQNINDMILSGDSQADVSSSHDSDSGIDDDPLVHSSVPPQPQRERPSRQPCAYSLPSPTFSPSRRELDRWDPSCAVMGVTSCCSPSCAGSTATTATTMSEEEGYYDQPYNNNNYNDDCNEEIRSNATTLVVSHHKQSSRDRNYYRRNQLLTSTLASAEQRLRKQLLEEDARAEYLKTRREQQQQRRGPR